MSFRSGIFNSTEATLTPEGLVRGNKAVDASFFASIFKNLFTNGVFLTEKGGGFHCEPYFGNTENGMPNLSVKLTSGACHIGGYFAFDDEEAIHTFPQSATYSTYVHRLRLDLASGEITSAWILCRQVGSIFNAIDNYEALPTRTAQIYDLLTTRIDIPAGVTSITETTITDLRQNASLCGIVAGAVTELDTAQWCTQMTAYVTALREATAALPAEDIAAFAMGKLSDDMANLAPTPNAAAMQILANAHSHAPNTLTAGTLPNTVKAPTGSDYDTFRPRNIAFGETLPMTTATIGEGDILGVLG